MSLENINYTQRGHDNTQIAEQNNNEITDNSYNEQNDIDAVVNNHTEFNNFEVSVNNQSTTYVGASLEEVTRIVTNLFLDNFPRMQQIAKITAEARFNELWNEFVTQIPKKGITDLSPFKEIDVQYVVYEAQKGYARFATPDLLSTLSSLIAERIKQNNSDQCLKVTIDRALSIAHLLSSEQLDHLSLLFIVTKVKFSNINTIADLNRHLRFPERTFISDKLDSWQYLQIFGCLQLELPDICGNYASMYNFDVKEVEKICPDSIKQHIGDYSTSPLGTMLAITNAEIKTNYKFDPNIWIHS